MTNVIIDILSYIVFIALLTAVVSGDRMAKFLYQRGLVRFRHFGIDHPISRYMEITKRETGEYGIWAKIHIISFIIGTVAAITLVLLMSFGEYPE